MRVPRLLQAVSIMVGAFLILKFAVQPPIPVSVLRLYMFFIVVGVLLYFTYDERSAKELAAPLVAFARGPQWRTLRGVSLIVIPALGGYLTYSQVSPTFEAPAGLRVVHPAPPSSVTVYKNSYNLLTLENPLRKKSTDVKQLAREGGQIYFRNCFYCHGDQLNGQGHFAKGFNLRPANFQDVGTIAQLQESYVFWRVATGGPGLPDESTPWDSAMPRWQDMLTEEEVWKVILFLYDYTGYVPRKWEQ